MSQSQTSSAISKSVRTIIWAGLVAGTLDAIGATVVFMLRGGKDPSGIWKYVASGVFGKEAFTNGSGMALWGLFFHFSIAVTFAVFFFLMYPIIRRFFRNPVLVGLLYGILVWFVMNLIVLPLSNVTTQPFELSRVLIGMGILMVCIGLPISLIVSRQYSER